MSYSSALFDGTSEEPLQAAQDAGYRRILSRLAAEPGSAYSKSAVAGAVCRNGDAMPGCRSPASRLSPQLAWAQHRVPSADLRCRTTATTERFDHVVSIEMFEAVGERWWPTYFAPSAGPEAGRAGGDPEHHHPRRPVRRVPARHRFHPAIHLPRRHAAVARRLPHAAAARAWRCATSTPSASTTPAPWPNGAMRSTPAGRKSPKLGFDEPSAACGGMYLLLRGRLPAGKHRCRPVRTSRMPDLGAGRAAALVPNGGRLASPWPGSSPLAKSSGESETPLLACAVGERRIPALRFLVHEGPVGRDDPRARRWPASRLQAQHRRQRDCRGQRQECAGSWPMKPAEALGRTMARLFPDVKPGITSLASIGRRAVFLFNGQARGNRRGGVCPAVLCDLAGSRTSAPGGVVEEGRVKRLSKLGADPVMWIGLVRAWVSRLQRALLSLLRQRK